MDEILHGNERPARYRRHDRQDRDLSMATAAAAMPGAGGTSPSLLLRAPAPPPFPARPPQGHRSRRRQGQGYGERRELMHAVKVTDPAAVVAMEGFNPGHGRGSCYTPEMGRQ
jgi:hypothetical protein